MYSQAICIGQLKFDTTFLVLSIFQGRNEQMKVPDLATFIYRLPNYFFPTSTGIMFRSFAFLWKALVVISAVGITVASVWYELSLWGAIK